MIGNIEEMEQKTKRKREKLYNQLKIKSRNVPFRKFTKTLLDFGYILDRQKGSHQIFIRAGESRISVQPDKNGQAKAYQVKQFLNEVEELNLLERL